MKKLGKFIWTVIGILYFPIFIAFWLLAYVARTILAISYIGQLDFRYGWKTLKYTFKRNAL